MAYDVEKIADYPDNTEFMKIRIVDRTLVGNKLKIEFEVTENETAGIEWIKKKTNALQGKFALIPRNQGSKG